MPNANYILNGAIDLRRARTIHFRTRIRGNGEGTSDKRQGARYIGALHIGSCVVLYIWKYSCPRRLRNLICEIWSLWGAILGSF